MHSNKFEISFILCYEFTISACPFFNLIAGLLLFLLTKRSTLKSRHGSRKTKFGPNFVISCNHVLQCSNRLGPSTSLETAIGVDTEMLDLNTRQETLDLVLDKLYRGYNWRMNIVSSWTQSFAVSDSLECTEGVVIVTGVLDGVHISVHAINCLHAVVKLAVAHVGVDLSFVLGSSGRKTEGINSPPQVLFLLRFTQRHGLAKGRLVDLYDGTSL